MKFAFLIEPPFNDRDASGSVIGHDVEIAAHVFAALGEPFEPIEATFAELLPGLATGRWTMTTGLFATEVRRRQALFTRPIWALPDGLLVPSDNPLALRGYKSIAGSPNARLAVVRDQAQQVSALRNGVPPGSFRVFETYAEAADAVLTGEAEAYASVYQAHTGYLETQPDTPLAAIAIPADEKPPAPGCFAVGFEDHERLSGINSVLDHFLGSEKHREIASRYGFTTEEIGLVAAP